MKELVWPLIVEMAWRDTILLVGVLMIPVLWPLLFVVINLIRIKCSYETCPLVGFARTMFGG